MVMTVDSTSNNHSPRSPGDGINSPQFRQQNSSPPWAQVVRGEPETISAVPRSPSSSMTKQTAFPDIYASKTGSMADNSTVAESPLENSDSNNSKVSRTTGTVWNKPLNGVIDVSPVMGGAGSWPALSESTRPKPSPDSSKPILDGSVSISQVPVISHSPPKQVNTNANRNVTPNPTLPVRQRSMKRGGGGSAQSNFTRLPPPPPPPPPPPQPFPSFELPYSTLVSPREPPYKSNYWERPIGGFFSKSHAGNDHPSQRNSSRRGNFGPRPRGDGSHHNSYGSRRDHDRDWSASRSSNVRDVPHQTPPPRSSIRHPPPGSTPFITPQPVGPFGNPMSFDMRSPFIYVPSESFRSVPFVPPMSPPPMFFPVSDPSLPGLLLNQIDYYFSDDNLVKDNFLKSNMDDQGWVPITLISGFPRVQHLTYNIQLILDSLRASTVVEVQGDKVRRRNEWRKWMPASGRFPTDSGSHSPSVSGYNILATSFQKVTLDEVSINRSSAMGKADPVTEAAPGRHSSEELAGQSKLANGEGTDEEA